MGNPKFTRNIKRRGANVHDQTLSVSIVEQIELDWFHKGDKESVRKAIRGGTLTRPVIGKYIYILRHQGNFDGGEKTPELCEEIYADSSGNWYEAKKPGTGEDLLRNTAGQPLYFPTPEKVNGYLYHFFLSPFRLDSECLDLLKKWIRKESAKRKAISLSPDLANQAGPWWIKGGNVSKDISQVIDPEVTTVACQFEKTGRPYEVAVPDPFELARARNQLFHHGALGLLDIYNNHTRTRDETIIATTLQAVGGNQSWDYIKNDLVNGWDNLKWWRAEGRDKAPVFSAQASYTATDNMGNSYTAQVNHLVEIKSGHWRKLAASHTRTGITVADLYLAGQKLVREKLMLHASECAQRLCAWLNSPRHRLVDQAARACGGDDLAVATAHWSFVTQRLSETVVGQIFLITHAKDETSLFHAMWTLLGLSLPASGEAEKAAQKAVSREAQKKAVLQKNFWEESGEAQKVFFAILDLVKNFAGALHGIDANNLERAVNLLSGKSLYSKAGLVFARIPSEKLTLKLGLFSWEKQVVLQSSLMNPYILVSNESRLRRAFLDEKGFYKRFKLEGCFKGFSYTAKTINLFLAAAKVMNGKAQLHEEIKLGLDAIATVADGVDMYRNLRRPISLPGEPPAPVTASAITKVGAVAGAIGGFIDFHVAVTSTLKSYYEKGNMLETAANVGGVVTAAVSAGLGVYALLVPAAAAGPIGWIALALAAVGLFFTWLASRLSRDNWEEFARYCFLGTGYMNGTQFSGTDRGIFLLTTPTRFGAVANLPKQIHSLYGLMAGFYFKTRPSGEWNEELYGEIQFFPGWTGNMSKVTFYWQFEYDDNHYAYLEVLFSTRYYWGKVMAFESTNKKLAIKEVLIRRPGTGTAGQPGSFFIYPKFVDQPIHVRRVLVAASLKANEEAEIPYNSTFEFDRRSDTDPRKRKKFSMSHCAGTIYTPSLTRVGGGDKVDGF